MKRLRKEVKEVLFVGIAIISLIGLFITLNNQYNDAVNDCVNAGNSVAMCESGLR